MPRFFFRTYDDDGEPHLDQGCELPDVETAQREAVRVLREMACITRDLEDERYVAVDVLDELGSTVIRARLNETIEMVGQATGSILPSARLTDGFAAPYAFRHTTH
jgi:hypothetical protein